MVDWQSEQSGDLKVIKHPYINRDILFLPGDKYYRPDYQTIREWITNMLSEISRKCVIRKGPTDP